MALSELELAQERKARLKGDGGHHHHVAVQSSSRQIAGQELPRHAEHQLPEGAVKEDLDAIAECVGSGDAALLEKKRRKSSGGNADAPIDS